MYEKYRELSWDLHNSVTSDRVIVNNSRRYFIKASLYRRWSSPTNRTICKHCNICRRLQPRPSILPFPLLFLRFLHRIFLEISSISHFPVFIRTRRQREINHPDENVQIIVLQFYHSVKFPSLLEFSAQLILRFWTTAIEHWSKHIGIKLKKSFYFDSPREHFTIHFAISFKNIPRIRDYSFILKTPTPIRNSVFSSLRKIFPSMNIHLKKWKSNGNEKM